MNKCFRKLLLSGMAFLMSCTPIKHNSHKDPKTLEEILAPYTITKQEFRKKYEPEVTSNCTRYKKPDIDIITFDDKTPTLMALYSYICSPDKKTNRRYAKEYESGKILHGDYIIVGESAILNGFLEPEQYSYFQKFVLSNGKSFIAFDINRDGDIDFNLYADSPVHPLPKNLGREEIIKNSF